CDNSAPVRVVLERAARRVEKAPRHPEVNQENPTALEPNNQILAAPLDRCDAFAFELSRHLGRLIGTDETHVVDAHALEAPTDERGLELPADALDLRQLRHTVSVVAWWRPAERPTATPRAGPGCRATAPCRRATRSRSRRRPRTRPRGPGRPRSVPRRTRAGVRARASGPSTPLSGRTRDLR